MNIFYQITILTIFINSVLSFKQFKNTPSQDIECPFGNNKRQLNKKFYKNKKEHDVSIIYPAWKPKEKKYNPKKVDWSSVISGCHAACNFDIRLCNFYVRASAHDSLSIAEGYGGPDGSVVLTEDELNRPENNYDLFAYKLSKNALALAKKFDTSVADIISVCGAYAVKYTGGIDIISTSSNQEPFLVGRIDSTIPNPANQLVPENANTTLFNSYAEHFGLTLEDFTALLGSHALIDNKECLNRDRISFCDPLINECKDISMFYWDNSYYIDLCSKNISMRFNDLSTEFIKSKKQLIRNELCKFTSSYFRDEIKTELNTEFEINVNEILNQNIEQENLDLIIETETQFPKNVVVDVVNNGDKELWRYTTNDAWLGLACQNKLEDNNINNQIKYNMDKFSKDDNLWDLIYARAYKKMINNNVRWFKKKSDGFKISGTECYSGYKIYKGQRICKTAFAVDEQFYE